MSGLRGAAHSRGVMHTTDFIRLALFLVAFIALTPLLGGFTTRVFAGEAHLFTKPPPLAPAPFWKTLIPRETPVALAEKARILLRKPPHPLRKCSLPDIKCL